jgi:drug/metabolite transporter (DMT)-like permease
LGFGLFFYGLRSVEASRASFLTYVEVVSGIFFGMVFFHERLSWNIVAGGSLVLLSALALSRKERNQREEA